METVFNNPHIFVPKQNVYDIRNNEKTVTRDLLSMTNSAESLLETVKLFGCW